MPRALDPPILGPKFGPYFGPIPNAKKYVFFPIQQKKKNQSSMGNIIHKDDVKFPNFSQNAAYFLNSMGPGPIPKKGV